MEVADYQYLIIAGVPKAATSSLFSYLAAHPAICGAYIKETCFFLDADYPSANLRLRADYSYLDGLECYSKYFRECTDDRQIRLDATPDYLYSPGTAKRLAASLPNSRLVFILREPISRLLSYYGYAKQRAEISQLVSFDEYVQLLRSHALRDTYSMDGLEHGRYSRFLPAYYDAFGRERILAFFYEELLGDPKKLVQSICTYVNIAPEFFESFPFDVHNKTHSLRYPQVNAAFIKLRLVLRRVTYRYRIHKYFQRARIQAQSRLFELLKERSPQRPGMSQETHQFLIDYYYGNGRQDLLELERLIDRPVPWMGQ